MGKVEMRLAVEDKKRKGQWEDEQSGKEKKDR